MGTGLYFLSRDSVGFASERAAVYLIIFVHRTVLHVAYAFFCSVFSH